ncbi:MAG: hypothetical protein Q7J44_18875, partial [Pseudotabrizicola sp.]|uniref:hypothetical protein n=1 Tax=Pseudotabrizicola sp. TaxID=2939647 RepID=UPI0027190336
RQSSVAQNQKHLMPTSMHRYVPSLASEAIDRATDLDFGAHKKTGHKRSTITRRVIRRRPRLISA